MGYHVSPFEEFSSRDEAARRSSPYKTGQSAYQQSQVDYDDGEVKIVHGTTPTNPEHPAVYDPGYGSELKPGGDTLNNTTVWDTFVDAADAGFFNMASGTAKFLGDTLESEMLNNIANDLKKRAEYNTENPNVFKNDNARWWANAIGTAAGSSVPTILGTALVAGASSFLGAGAAAGAAAGNAARIAMGASQTSKALGVLAQAAQKYKSVGKITEFASKLPTSSLGQLQMGRLIGNIPESMSEAGHVLFEAEKSGMNDWDKTKAKWQALGENAVALTVADIVGNKLENMALDFVAKKAGLSLLSKGADKSLKAIAARAGIMGVTDSPKEGAEEFVQNYIHDSSLGKKFDVDQAWEEAKMGAAGGLFLGGAGGAITGKFGNNEVRMKAVDESGKEHTITASKENGGTYTIDGEEASAEQFYSLYNNSVPENERITLDDYKANTEKGKAHYGIGELGNKYNEAIVGLTNYKADTAEEQEKLDDMVYAPRATYESIQNTIDTWEKLKQEKPDNVGKRPRVEIKDAQDKRRKAKAVAMGAFKQYIEDNNERTAALEKEQARLQKERDAAFSDFKQATPEAQKTYVDQVIDWAKSPDCTASKESAASFINAINNPSISLADKTALAVSFGKDNNFSLGEALERAQNLQQSPAQQSAQQPIQAEQQVQKQPVPSEAKAEIVKQEAEVAKQQKGEQEAVVEERPVVQKEQLPAEQPVAKAPSKQNAPKTQEPAKAAPATHGKYSMKSQSEDGNTIVYSKAGGVKIELTKNGDKWDAVKYQKKKGQPKQFNSIEEAIDSLESKTSRSASPSRALNGTEPSSVLNHADGDEYIYGTGANKLSIFVPKDGSDVIVQEIKYGTYGPENYYNSFEEAIEANTEDSEETLAEVDAVNDTEEPIGKVEEKAEEAPKVKKAPETKEPLEITSEPKAEAKETPKVEETSPKEEVKSQPEEKSDSTKEETKVEEKPVAQEQAKETKQEADDSEQLEKPEVIKQIEAFLKDGKVPENWREAVLKQYQAGNVAVARYIIEDLNFFYNNTSWDMSNFDNIAVGFSSLTRNQLNSALADLTDMVSKALPKDWRILTEEDEIREAYEKEYGDKIEILEFDYKNKHILFKLKGESAIQDKAITFHKQKAIALPANFFTLDTPIHEYTHVWWALLDSEFDIEGNKKTAEQLQKDKQLLSDIEEVVKETRMYKELMQKIESNKDYKDLYGDTAVEEVFCRLVGYYSTESFTNPNFEAEVLGKANKSAFRRILDKLLNFVRSLFGKEEKHDKSVKDIASALKLPIATMLEKGARIKESNTENFEKVVNETVENTEAKANEIPEDKQFNAQKEYFNSGNELTEDEQKALDEISRSSKPSAKERETTKAKDAKPLTIQERNEAREFIALQITRLIGGDKAFTMSQAYANRYANALMKKAVDEGYIKEDEKQAIANTIMSGYFDALKYVKGDKMHPSNSAQGRYVGPILQAYRDAIVEISLRTENADGVVFTSESLQESINKCKALNTFVGTYDGINYVIQNVEALASKQTKDKNAVINEDFAFLMQLAKDAGLDIPIETEDKVDISKGLDDWKRKNIDALNKKLDGKVTYTLGVVSPEYKYNAEIGKFFTPEFRFQALDASKIIDRWNELQVFSITAGTGYGKTYVAMGVIMHKLNEAINDFKASKGMAASTFDEFIDELNKKSLMGEFQQFIPKILVASGSVTTESAWVDAASFYNKTFASKTTSTTFYDIVENDDGSVSTISEERETPNPFYVEGAPRINTVRVQTSSFSNGTKTLDDFEHVSNTAPKKSKQTIPAINIYISNFANFTGNESSIINNNVKWNYIFADEVHSLNASYVEEEQGARYQDFIRYQDENKNTKFLNMSATIAPYIENVDPLFEQVVASFGGDMDKFSTAYFGALLKVSTDKIDEIKQGLHVRDENGEVKKIERDKLTGKYESDGAEGSVDAAYVEIKGEESFSGSLIDAYMRTGTLQNFENVGDFKRFLKCMRITSSNFEVKKEAAIKSITQAARNEFNKRLETAIGNLKSTLDKLPTRALSAKSLDNFFLTHVLSWEGTSAFSYESSVDEIAKYAWNDFFYSDVFGISLNDAIDINNKKSKSIEAMVNFSKAYLSGRALARGLSEEAKLKQAEDFKAAVKEFLGHIGSLNDNKITVYAQIKDAVSKISKLESVNNEKRLDIAHFAELLIHVFPRIFSLGKRSKLEEILEICKDEIAEVESSKRNGGFKRQEKPSMSKDEIDDLNTRLRDYIEKGKFKSLGAGSEDFVKYVLGKDGDLDDSKFVEEVYEHIADTIREKAIGTIAKLYSETPTKLTRSEVEDAVDTFRASKSRDTYKRNPFALYSDFIKEIPSDGKDSAFIDIMNRREYDFVHAAKILDARIKHSEFFIDDVVGETEVRSLDVELTPERVAQSLAINREIVRRCEAFAEVLKAQNIVLGEPSKAYAIKDRQAVLASSSTYEESCVKLFDTAQERILVRIGEVLKSSSQKAKLPTLKSVDDLELIVAKNKSQEELKGKTVESEYNTYEASINGKVFEIPYDVYSAVNELKNVSKKLEAGKIKAEETLSLLKGFEDLCKDLTNIDRNNAEEVENFSTRGLKGFAYKSVLYRLCGFERDATSDSDEKLPSPHIFLKQLGEFLRMKVAADQMYLDVAREALFNSAINPQSIVAEVSTKNTGSKLKLIASPNKKHSRYIIAASYQKAFESEERSFLNAYGNLGFDVIGALKNNWSGGNSNRNNLLNFIQGLREKDIFSYGEELMNPIFQKDSSDSTKYIGYVSGEKKSKENVELFKRKKKQPDVDLKVLIVTYQSVKEGVSLDETANIKPFDNVDFYYKRILRRGLIQDEISKTRGKTKVVRSADDIRFDIETQMVARACQRAMHDNSPVVINTICVPPSPHIYDQLEERARRTGSMNDTIFRYTTLGSFLEANDFLKANLLAARTAALARGSQYGVDSMKRIQMFLSANGTDIDYGQDALLMKSTGPKGYAENVYDFKDIESPSVTYMLDRNAAIPKKDFLRFEQYSFAQILEKFKSSTEDSKSSTSRSSAPKIDKTAMEERGKVNKELVERLEKINEEAGNSPAAFLQALIEDVNKEQNKALTDARFALNLKLGKTDYAYSKPFMSGIGRTTDDVLKQMIATVQSDRTLYEYTPNEWYFSVLDDIKDVPRPKNPSKMFNLQQAKAILMARGETFDDAVPSTRLEAVDIELDEVGKIKAKLIKAKEPMLKVERDRYLYKGAYKDKYTVLTEKEYKMYIQAFDELGLSHDPVTRTQSVSFSKPKKDRKLSEKAIARRFIPASYRKSEEFVDNSAEILNLLVSKDENDVVIYKRLEQETSDIAHKIADLFGVNGISNRFRSYAASLLKRINKQEKGEYLISGDKETSDSVIDVLDEFYNDIYSLIDDDIMLYSSDADNEDIANVLKDSMIFRSGLYFDFAMSDLTGDESKAQLNALLKDLEEIYPLTKYREEATILEIPLVDTLESASVSHSATFRPQYSDEELVAQMNGSFSTLNKTRFEDFSKDPQGWMSRFYKEFRLNFVDKNEILKDLDTFSEINGKAMLGNNIHAAAQASASEATGIAVGLAEGDSVKISELNATHALDGTEDELNGIGTIKTVMERFDKIYRAHKKKAKELGIDENSDPLLWFVNKIAHGDEYQAISQYLGLVILNERYTQYQHSYRERLAEAVRNGKEAPDPTEEYELPEGMTIQGIREILRKLGWDFDVVESGGNSYLINKIDIDIQPIRDAQNHVHMLDKVKVISGENAILKDVSEAYREVNFNMLKLMHSNGLLDRYVKEKMMFTTPDYAPLARDIDETTFDTFLTSMSNGGSGMANVSTPLKHIKREGSGEIILLPLESTLKAIAITSNRCIRNKVALMAVGSINRAVDEALAPYRAAVNDAKTPEQRKKANDEYQAKIEQLEATRPIAAVKPIIKLTEGGIKQIGNAEANPAKRIFTVMKQGHKFAYQVKDSTYSRELYNAIIGYEPVLFDGIERFAENTATLLRAGATLQPSFIARNFLRDTVFASVSSQHGFVPFLDSSRGLFKLLTDKKFKAEFEAAGIGTFHYLNDVERSAKTLEEIYSFDDKKFFKCCNDLARAHRYWKSKTKRKAIDKALDGIINMAKPIYDSARAFSDLAEESTRAGEYIKAKAYAKNIMTAQNASRKSKGLSAMSDRDIEQAIRMYAATAARNVTLDFGRNGIKGRKWNRVIPFFNASIQGVDKLISLPNRDQKAFFVKLAAYILLPTLACWLAQIAWAPDERFKTNSSMRYSYWMIPIGDKEFLRIPKPQELGIVLGSLMEAALDTMYLKDKDAMKAYATECLNVLIPNIVPTLLLPIGEWLANYNVMTGRPIESKRIEKLPLNERYTPNTTITSRKVANYLYGSKFADTLGISPLKLDNTIRGYFGTGGYFAWMGLNAIDEIYGDQPLRTYKEIYPLRDFFITENNQTQDITRYYAFATQLDSLASSTRTDEEAKNARIAIARIRKFKIKIGNDEKTIAGANAEIRKIYDNVGEYANWSPERKRERLKEIEHKVKACCRVILEDYQEKSGYYVPPASWFGRKSDNYDDVIGSIIVPPEYSPKKEKKKSVFSNSIFKKKK